MNASTFTARVTSGRVFASPYPESSAAAVGSLSGPLHGGANEEVSGATRRDRFSADNVKAWLDAKLAKKNPKHSR